jgi:hypothetical protein
MQGHLCLTCGAQSGGTRLCPACRKRADQIWEKERTLVVCPNPDCGWSPLEDKGLFAMFPRQASIANADDLIVLLFDQHGCHRCAPKDSLPIAEVYRLRANTQPPSSS